ncbi:MAG: gliding motility-associated C-terminal domain-containing protein [Bacteroidales bacterium]|nr:gliding motility-associated C-terminal domain-containing protein [Bacteroidales bacterium]MCL2132997.1 gliding motility-associated C-terminal domain-containing protein [Bacteroidales bacterium]
MLLGFLPFMSYTQTTDSQVILGGNVANNELQIIIRPNGRYIVNRYINHAYQKQFYDATTTPLFSIKIGNMTFSSGGLTPASAGPPVSGVILTAFNSIADVGTPVTTGVNQTMTKRFTGTYSGNTFTVTLRITYNTSSPDYLIKHATIDATSIPGGTPITLAYGWDTYLGTSDRGYAYILPDIFGLNNNASPTTRYLTTAQAQSLRFVGTSNNSVSGTSMIGFFPVGRDFDKAWAANPYESGYSYNMPVLGPGNGTGSGTNTQYKFEFGPYSTSSAPDNGQGVAYDNIPAGSITVIETGLSFTPAFDGELDYFWNGVKDHTANIGDNVTLDLDYTSYSGVALTNVGFRVDHAGLEISSGGCTSSGFTGGTADCTPGNEFYQLSGTSVAAMGTATVSVPVNIVRAGQWVLDGNSISNMTQTLPLGSPAMLTVATTLSLTDDEHKSVCRGLSQDFAVKFPSTVTAANSVTVEIFYAGATSEFSSMPTSVTIPAGSNSATFTVVASPTGANNSAITITLSSTDQTFVTVDNPSSVTLTITVPTINSALTASICSGTAFSYTATSAESGASFSWSRAAVAGITPVTNTGSDASINETLVNTTEEPIDVTYEFTLLAGCTNTQNLVVTVNPLPVVNLSVPTVCSGMAGTLTAEVTAGSTTAMTYTWYEGASSIATTTEDSYTLSALTSAANYSVEVLNSNGCLGSATPMLSTIYPLPELVTCADTEVCYGDMTDISATVANVSSTITWYSLSDYSNTINSGETITVLPPITSLYYVEAISDNHCSARDSVKVFVNPLPVLIISNSNICAGDSITVTASTIDSSDGLNWYADPAHSIFIRPSSFTIILTADTVFYVKAESVHRCVSSGSLSITVTQPPRVKAMDDLRICYGEEITLTTLEADGDISWNTLATTLHLTASTYYLVTASRAPCPDVQDTVHITVRDSLYINPPTIPAFESNKYYEQQLQTNATVPYYYSIVSGELPTGMSFHADGLLSGTPPFDGQLHTFVVQVLDEHGCSVVQPYSIYGNLFVPIVFSPNNDGVNDHFMKGEKVIIFDRTGIKIFEGNDGWDGTYKGKDAPVDTYFYILFYLNSEGGESKQTGSITIVR